MKIGVITTSRADFGIYLPLLHKLKSSATFELSIFVGGMHLRKKYGYTIQQIEDAGFSIEGAVDSLSDGDSASDISRSMAATVEKFSGIWESLTTQPDIIFVLGDRFEMFAAAASILPFGIKIAHLHGGESSLGSLDHRFRNAITSFSDYHFTSAQEHADRVAEILGNNDQVYDVGALGVEGLLTTPVYDREVFETKYGLEQNEPFVLSTFHPETTHSDNENHIGQLINAFEQLPERVIFTLPNADHQGDVIRNAVLAYQEQVGKQRISCFENLGQQGYYSAMKHCELMIGNTSSGIIEAASFNTPVIDVGDRQKGRVCGENVIHVVVDGGEIVKAYKEIREWKDRTFVNPYGQGTTSEKIIEILTNIASA